MSTCLNAIRRNRKIVACGAECSRKETDYCNKCIAKLEKQTYGEAKSRDGSTNNGAAKDLINVHYPVDNFREFIKDRDELVQDEKCTFCMKTCSPNELDMDHLFPSCCRSDNVYGTNSILNLVPACKNCNGSKGGKTGKKFEDWLYTRCDDPTQIQRILAYIGKPEIRPKLVCENLTIISLIQTCHRLICEFHKLLHYVINTFSINTSVRIFETGISDIRRFQKEIERGDFDSDNDLDDDSEDIDDSDFSSCEEKDEKEKN
jgi:hypothetical protein